MRDRLIELLRKSGVSFEYATPQEIADRLLAEGVIVPPCKVGDVVYTLVNWCDYKDCHFEGCAGCSHCNDKGIKETKFHYSHIDAIGKTVFLTREEAERALAEMRE